MSRAQAAAGPGAAERSPVELPRRDLSAARRIRPRTRGARSLPRAETARSVRIHDSRAPRATDRRAGRGGRHFAHALELEPGFVPARSGTRRPQVLLGDWTDAERQFRALVADGDVPPAAPDRRRLRPERHPAGPGRFSDRAAPARGARAADPQGAIREAMALAERGIAEAELGRLRRGRRAHRAGNRTRTLPGTRHPLPVCPRHAAPQCAAMPPGLRDRRRKSARSWPGARTRRNCGGAQNGAQGGSLSRWHGCVRRGRSREGATATLARSSPCPATSTRSTSWASRRPCSRPAGTPRRSYSRAAASTERDPGDIRLDLEPDRSQALLLEAEILAAQGRNLPAPARARDFLQRWSNAKPAIADRAPRRIGLDKAVAAACTRAAPPEPLQVMAPSARCRPGRDRSTTAADRCAPRPSGSRPRRSPGRAAAALRSTGSCIPSLRRSVAVKRPS